MTRFDKRTRILEFIKEFIYEKGYAPTITEIQVSCGISSKSVVEYHLKALEREGFIRRDAEISRSIEVSGIGRRARPLPLLGTIAAGQPIPVPTEETWHTIAEETVEVTSTMLPRGAQAYALRVKGKSMIDAFVDDGDIVIVEATPIIENGQMAVAWLIEEQTVTLKKLYREPERIRLQPANPTMEPTYINPGNLQVQGKVIGVLRKYSPGSL